MNLRYTGALPVTFVESVGEVEPGGEFFVPDEDAPRYLARADVEQVRDAPARKPKTAKAVADEPSADTTTAN